MRISLLVSVALLGPASAVAQEELPLMSELLAQSVESHERLLEFLRARPTEDMTESQLVEHEAHIVRVEGSLERDRDHLRVATGAENAMRFRDEAFNLAFNYSRTFEEFAGERLERIRNDIVGMRAEGVSENRIAVLERELAAEVESLAAVQAELDARGDAQAADQDVIEERRGVLRARLEELPEERPETAVVRAALEQELASLE